MELITAIHETGDENQLNTNASRKIDENSMNNENSHFQTIFDDSSNHSLNSSDDSSANRSLKSSHVQTQDSTAYPVVHGSSAVVQTNDHTNDEVDDQANDQANDNVTPPDNITEVTGSNTRTLASPPDYFEIDMDEPQIAPPPYASRTLPEYVEAPESDIAIQKIWFENDNGEYSITTDPFIHINNDDKLTVSVNRIVLININNENEEICTKVREFLAKCSFPLGGSNEDGTPIVKAILTDFRIIDLREKSSFECIDRRIYQSAEAFFF